MAPYLIKLEVSSVARDIGSHFAHGGAACILRGSKTHQVVTKMLVNSQSPKPDHQRADLTAMILALNWAEERINGLVSSPEIKVEIQSDSRFAVNMMKKFIDKWAANSNDRSNGWLGARGDSSSNLNDLLESLLQTRKAVTEARGQITCTWVPRNENATALKHAREALEDAAWY